MQDLIFGLIGGTALLMYGIEKMGSGLEKISGPMMKRILEVFTGNVFKSTLAGILITALVQSSTAVTVLTVGFVNAGLMKFSQAIGIIYGANIGTTVTAQLMALSFKFKLTDIALPVLGLGFAIMCLAKKDHWKNLGSALMGFGLMFYGLKILNSGAPYMQNSESLKYFFIHYASIPLVGVMLGIVATALVHSSAATVALVMVLGASGLIDFPTAIYLTLGDNIGTCITAQLASANGSINARRTAWAHTLYNMVGVLLVIFFVPQFARFVEWTTSLYYKDAAIDVLIANTHTIFNVASAVVFMPFTKYFVKALETMVKQDDEPNQDDDDDSKVMDNLLLTTPIAAVGAVKRAIHASVLRSRSMFFQAMDFVYTNNQDSMNKVLQQEDKLNITQKKLTDYTIQLSKGNLSGIQAHLIPALIICMNHVERTGDYANDLVELAQRKTNAHLEFSDIALTGLKEMENMVVSMYDLLAEEIDKPGKSQTNYKKLKDLENEVDIKARELLDGHVHRLEEGLCTVDAGVYYMDLVNFLERISDHIYKAYRDLLNGETT